MQDRDINYLVAMSYFIKAIVLSETVARGQEKGAHLQTIIFQESQQCDYPISEQRFNSGVTSMRPCISKTLQVWLLCILSARKGGPVTSSLVKSKCIEHTADAFIHYLCDV